MGLGDWLRERKEQKQREQLRTSQRNADIAAGKYCKICMRMGEFGNKCEDCGLFPICNSCMHRRRNDNEGTICHRCFPKYACGVPNCPYLIEESCINCGRAVCQDHWSALFIFDKNKVFSCVFQQHRGNVCKLCVVQTGTFRKKYVCKKCGNELHQRIIN